MRYALPIFGVFAVMCLVYAIFVAAPARFPEGTLFSVEEGSSITDVATRLGERHVVASPLIFKVAARAYGGVQAGSYGLAEPQSVLTLARRLSQGDTGLSPVSVTIPEGSTNRDIIAILETSVPEFDVTAFATLIEDKEGYLFPDTYQFFPGTPPSVVYARFSDRYESQVAPLRDAIKTSGHTEHEILTMASILEKEARKFETKQMVAGILWKRIEIGMPLQVDAVFGFIYGKPTFSPTFDELEVDSPYNTYKNKGLPPGPIGNPGLDSIRAALEPVSSPYLYYLTGVDGTMYYSRTFDQHVDNRRYLR
jgi:UPF0755 protein